MQMAVVGWPELLNGILLNPHTAKLVEIQVFATCFGGKRNKWVCKR